MKPAPVRARGPRRAVAAAFLGAAGALAAPAAGADEAGAGALNPFEGRADLVRPGRTLFNVHCSHCHGPNAVQGERRRDLRRLARRHGAHMPDAFLATVMTGREDKGMPSWDGVLPVEDLWTIFTFLQTVQKR